MTLIKCPECGKEISDKAEACIHCGCPRQTICEPTKVIEKEEVQYMSVCQCCTSIRFTYKIGIDKAIETKGYPTCGACGGRIKVLAGKSEWMEKTRLERDAILREEVTAAQNGKDYKPEMARQWGNGIRPDLDVQGYCPKCAKYYPMSIAMRRGIENCEFCGTRIKYSDILSEDFKEEFDKHMCGNIPKDSDVGAFIIQKFLVNEPEFSEIAYNKRINPNQYVEKKTPEKNNVPKCPTCQSTNIKKISGLSKAGSVAMWGLFSRKVHKQWHCNNCGSEW